MDEFNLLATNPHAEHFQSQPRFIRAGLFYADKYSQVHAQSSLQKYFACELLKNQGNLKFKKQDLISALQYYEEALSIFRYVHTPRLHWRTDSIQLTDSDMMYVDDNGRSDREKKMIKQLKVILYQNICIVYMKLCPTRKGGSLIDDAYLASCEAVKLDLKASKALYLRAKSRLRKQIVTNDDFKASIKDLRKSLELDEDNVDILDELQRSLEIYHAVRQREIAMKSHGSTRSKKKQAAKESEEYEIEEMSNETEQYREVHYENEENEDEEVEEVEELEDHEQGGGEVTGSTLRAPSIEKVEQQLSSEQLTEKPNVRQSADQTTKLSEFWKMFPFEQYMMQLQKQVKTPPSSGQRNRNKVRQTENGSACTITQLYLFETIPRPKTTSIWNRFYNSKVLMQKYMHLNEDIFPEQMRSFLLFIQDVEEFLDLKPGEIEAEINSLHWSDQQIIKRMTQANDSGSLPALWERLSATGMAQYRQQQSQQQKMSYFFTFLFSLIRKAKFCKTTQQS